MNKKTKNKLAVINITYDLLTKEMKYCLSMCILFV